MSTMEPLSLLLNINLKEFSKEEHVLLELDLFSRIYEELMEVFKLHHKEYFSLIKFNNEMENNMIELKFTRFIIQDILSTGEYNLAGIAHYTQTHEDVLYEIYTETNLQPSAIVLRKIIELHRTVRQTLYQKIIEKIIQKYALSIQKEISDKILEIIK